VLARRDGPDDSKLAGFFENAAQLGYDS
jgi:hypothetical protein